MSTKGNMSDSWLSIKLLVLEVAWCEFHNLLLSSSVCPFDGIKDGRIRHVCSPRMRPQAEGGVLKPDVRSLNGQPMAQCSLGSEWGRWGPVHCFLEVIVCSVDLFIYCLHQKASCPPPDSTDLLSPKCLKPYSHRCIFLCDEFKVLSWAKSDSMELWNHCLWCWVELRQKKKRASSVTHLNHATPSHFASFWVKSAADASWKDLSYLGITAAVVLQVSYEASAEQHRGYRLCLCLELHICLF